ncbi:hypothetical protein V6N13_147524 [Hibiscus sabdariffa]|uniref:Uncharacterized protein n=1 Tax=Hibiscus sabdariffa TaxID=183260 RepID=A0ABR2TVR7_9ROSI
MAKASEITLLFFIVCISSSFSFSHGTDKPNIYTVTGHVYCDTCNVESENKLSDPLLGASVKLVCTNPTDNTITYQTPEIITSAKGDFRLHVPGEYKDSTCEAILTRSPTKACDEPVESLKKAKVVITTKDGVPGVIPCPNSLAFKNKVAPPECKDLAP